MIEMQRKWQGEERAMLSKLLSEKLIKLNIDAKDWCDAIRQSAQPLVLSNKVEARYVDAIIDSVKESGPYIVITKHVAIPHARSQMGVIETAIGVATLKEPVVFGNKENDPVKYIFCLSAKENKEHLEALAELADLLEDENFYKVLDQATQPKEILKYVSEKERR